MMMYNNQNVAECLKKGTAMEWITANDIAEQWGMTKRRAQFLCANGKVDGALKLGNMWVIPKGTPKPIDGRTKVAKALKMIPSGE